MEKYYYGRPASEIPAAQLKNSPVGLGNKLFMDLLFGGWTNNRLRGRNFSPEEVNHWTIQLVNGIIPEGYSNVEDFQKYLEKRYNSTYRTRR